MKLLTESEINKAEKGKHQSYIGEAICKAQAIATAKEIFDLLGDLELLGLGVSEYSALVKIKNYK